MRIGKKLVVSYTLLAIVTFLITGLILRAAIAHFYMENLTQQVITEANAFEIAVNELGDDLEGERTALLLNKLADATGTRVTLIDVGGAVLADTQAPNPGMLANYAKIPEVQRALSGSIGKSTRYSNTIKQDVLYIATPFKVDGKQTGVLRIALPIAEIDGTLDRFNLIILAIAILATLLVIVTSHLLANSLTKPLKQMMTIAERMTNDDLDQELPAGRDDEFGELSKTFNDLAVKLKDRISEIRTEKAKAELILDNMVEGILLINKAGEVVLTNPAIERIFSVKMEDVLGNPVLHSIRTYDIAHALEESAESGKEVVDEIELKSPFRRLRIRVMPITNNVGEDQTLAVIRDITRQKQIERLRKDFIANVSHELKTPLTGLKLLSDTLLRSIETDPVSSKVFIKKLDKELSTLINMVRELIDLSKLEKHDTIEKEPVDLRDVVNEVVSSFYQLSGNKGISLTQNIQGDIPHVQGDRDQLLTLTRNLVDNAIRYSSIGGNISVELKRPGSDVILSVKDDGIGLAKRDIPRIFERFYRVDKARSRETGGTGLGLSIVKHVAENHHATVEVESSLGIGSTFTIRFPVDAQVSQTTA
jgi:two-component system phosphate regulon sensor histidine kinase PhoR